MIKCVLLGSFGHDSYCYLSRFNGEGYSDLATHFEEGLLIGPLDAGDVKGQKPSIETKHPKHKTH